MPKSGLGGWQLGEPGVVGRAIDWFGRVELWANLPGDKIVVGIRLIVAAEVRPSEITGFAGLIDFIVATGPPVGVIPGIGSDFAPVEIVVFLVDGNSVGVSTSHHVDFGPGFGCAFWKEVAFRDGVASLGIGFDAEDFSTEVVGVCGGSLGVEPFAIRSFVDRCRATGFKGAGIVSGR